MPTKGKSRKSAEERKDIIRTALRIQAGLENGLTITQLAEDHGITRFAIYKYLHHIAKDPEGKLRQAEEEVEWAIEILELLGYTEREIEAI